MRVTVSASASNLQEHTYTMASVSPSPQYGKLECAHHNAANPEITVRPQSARVVMIPLVRAASRCAPFKAPRSIRRCPIKSSSVAPMLKVFDQAFRSVFLLSDAAHPRFGANASDYISDRSGPLDLVCTC